MVVRLSSFCLLLKLAWASIPQLDGYSVVWSDDFNGEHGAAVSHSNWNQIARSSNPNGEVEIYTSGTDNVHLSGDGQLYIVPTKSGSTWSSGRLESVGSWACSATKAVIFQAKILVPDFTGSPAKFAGLWPSFWAKGQVYRSEGVGWPKCGEWDIFEVTDKLSDQNQGTLHFVDSNGQNNGAFSGRVTYKGGEYHTWAFKVDRRNSDWKKQQLTWYLDGEKFYQVTGADIGTAEQWYELAWSPFYVILNMAVGGGYPGNPTDSTVSGFDASMRVQYVAVYESN